MDTRLTKIFLRCVSRFEGTFRKNCKIQSVDLLFLVVLRAFTSADIIFHKFLELQSTLSEKKKKKKIFIKKFPFLTDSLKPSLLQPQNLVSLTKVFCRCSLTYHGFLRLLCYDDAGKN